MAEAVKDELGAGGGLCREDGAEFGIPAERPVGLGRDDHQGPGSRRDAVERSE